MPKPCKEEEKYNPRLNAEGSGANVLRVLPARSLFTAYRFLCWTLPRPDPDRSYIKLFGAMLPTRAPSNFSFPGGAKCLTMGMSDKGTTPEVSMF